MSNAATNGLDAPVDNGAKAFGRTYWLLNCIEAFERLSYYGIRFVVPIYIMQAAEPGGLQLTAMHKGTIYAWWALLQSFLPIVTGGIADRYGFKRVLFFSISLNIVGYVMMANLHGYVGFFAGILVLATGTAFFKPSLQGSLAQNLTKKNASLGWGIFYWVVNVGSFGAPFMSTAILGKPHSLEGWQTLFYACAGFTACNLLLLFTFKDVPSGASKTETVFQVLKRTILNVFEGRLIVWLLIMSCFWLMMYQLWDLHPNFITDWVDSSTLAAGVPFDAWWEYGDRGLIQVPQQILLSLNAALIIVLMVPLSWAARKMRTLSAMLVGMTVATFGVVLAGVTSNGWFLLLGIVFFSLGEMWTGPKKNEYLGLIAPPGKKGLYLGYVNIPIGIGVFVGSYMAGFVYDNYGEKANLAIKELGSQPALAARAVQAVDWSDQLHLVPELAGTQRQEALAAVAEQLGVSPAQAAEKLRRVFRHDAGQIINLGLLEIATHPDNRDSALKKLSDEVAGLDRNAAVTSFARHVHRLPAVVGKKRGEVWQSLRDLASKKPGVEAKQDGHIVADLWQRYGDDSGVMENLALEYLAQATGRVRDRVAKMTFADPVVEIPQRLGIHRSKAFVGLSAARGATTAELHAELEKLGFEPETGAVIYLIGQAHRRFLAVARRDWQRNTGALSELIGEDDAALAAAREIAGADADIATIAADQSALQAAFAKKDWGKNPTHAAMVLELNPYEASALAATDIKNSAQTTTAMLWNKYDPQYKVWIPFAIIGILATIALGVFGQMAKRWKDMNA